jgi:hypothetical protein
MCPPPPPGGAPPPRPHHSSATQAIVSAANLPRHPQPRFTPSSPLTTANLAYYSYRPLRHSSRPHCNWHETTPPALSQLLTASLICYMLTVPIAASQQRARPPRAKTSCGPDHHGPKQAAACLQVVDYNGLPLKPPPPGVPPPLLPPPRPPPPPPRPPPSRSSSSSSHRRRGFCHSGRAGFDQPCIQHTTAEYTDLGGGVHIDMFAHNKSGITYQNRN